MEYIEWLIEVTKAVNTEIVNSHASEKHGGWSENYITTRVLGAIENFGTELAWEELNQKIIWEGFKLVGKKETQFGDIAVLVRVQLLSDRFIEGVAFYEAKRQYFDSSGKVEGFKAARDDQFARLSKASNASNVLLYDVDPKEKLACATSVPTAMMTELAAAEYVTIAGRAVHRYGESWLSFLGANLKGYGLDFSSKSVEAIKKLSNSTDAPFAIMNVAVGKNGQNPILNSYFSKLPNYERAWGIVPPSCDDEDKNTFNRPKF